VVGEGGTSGLVKQLVTRGGAGVGPDEVFLYPERKILKDL